MSGEERFRPRKPLGGDPRVAAPPQHERASPFAAYPVPDLIADHRAEYAEHDGVPHVEVASLCQDPGGYEDGLARERHPGTLHHHPKEDDQVAVVLDEGKDLL